MTAFLAEIRSGRESFLKYTTQTGTIIQALRRRSTSDSRCRSRSRRCGGRAADPRDAWSVPADPDPAAGRRDDGLLAHAVGPGAVAVDHAQQRGSRDDDVRLARQPHGASGVRGAVHAGGSPAGDPGSGRDDGAVERRLRPGGRAEGAREDAVGVVDVSCQLSASRSRLCPPPPTPRPRPPGRP